MIYYAVHDHSYLLRLTLIGAISVHKNVEVGIILHERATSAWLLRMQGSELCGQGGGPGLLFPKYTPPLSPSP